MGCSVHSTPIAAAIISTRPRPVARSPRPSRPRSAGRSRSSASSTSRPTRRSFDGLGMRARGRSERAFRTLQDRLPKELALAGITTVEAANRWLAETSIPQHNAAFAVDAVQEGSAFLHDPTVAWPDILCIQEERTVGNDNTV